MVGQVTFLLFLLLIGETFGDASIIEVAQDAVKELELEDIEPTTCPGVGGCMRACPLGRERDDEGCRTCVCKKAGIFEGDIRVSETDYWRLIERYDKTEHMAPSKRQKRGAMSLKQSEWPRKGSIIEIPYVFGSYITGSKRKRIIQAIAQYKSRTCLRFVPRKSQKDYVEFTGLGGCSSHVGRIGGKQEITIGMNCEHKLGTVIHEMMHAIGFWHEQSRGDRDHYVEILWDNVIGVAKRNFDKQERFWNHYGSIYDLNSVMHYGGEFFGKDGKPTIVNRKTGEVIQAQRENFSPEDVRQINLKYKCSSFLKTDKPVQVPVFEPECKDDLTTCQKYLKKGYCKYDRISEKCKLTCQKCVPTKKIKPAPAPKKAAPKCKDEGNTCPTMKAFGFCKTSKEVMSKFCRKSCDFCGAESETITCRDISAKCAKFPTSYCTKSSKKKFMARACKKKCGQCAEDVPLSEEYLDMLITG